MIDRTYPRVIRALVALALLTQLTACLEPPSAVLSVSPRLLALSASTPGGLFVQNDGEAGSTLRFEASAEAAWLSIEPSAGVIEAGVTATLLVSIREGMTPRAGTTSEVTVSSNAGEMTVRVGVRRATGDSVCAHGLRAPGASVLTSAMARSTSIGALPPPSLPSTAAGGESLEVLVLYHEAVRYAPGTVTRAALSTEVTTAAGARLIRAGVAGQHDLVLLPGDDPETALDTLQRDPRVALVAPNVSVHRLGLVPNDPSYADQWWAWCFGVPEAWSVTTGDAASGDDDVIIAVVDDGFNVAHRDLATKLLPGFDFAEGNDDVRTSSPHGSHVAGIALASGDNGTAIAGIAYGDGIRLLPVKVFPDDVRQNGTLDTLVNGMRWAVGLPVANAPPNPNRANVVNLSLGVGSSPPATTVALFEATVAELRAQGAVVVAAAGNRGSGNGVEYPARAAGVIGVGSVDWTGLRSSFSTFGDGLDVMAPGGVAMPHVAPTCRYVLSLGASGEEGLYCQPGTSMAAPFVSGVVALLMAREPANYRSDPDAVAARLLSTALRGDGMSVVEYGAGIACPDAALGADSHCGWPGSE